MAARDSADDMRVLQRAVNGADDRSRFKPHQRVEKLEALMARNPTLAALPRDTSFCWVYVRQRLCEAYTDGYTATCIFAEGDGLSQTDSDAAVASMVKVFGLVSEAYDTLKTAHAACSLRVPSKELRFFMPDHSCLMQVAPDSVKKVYLDELAGRDPRDYHERKAAYACVADLGYLAAKAWILGVGMLTKTDHGQLSLVFDPAGDVICDVSSATFFALDVMEQAERTEVPPPWCERASEMAKLLEQMTKDLVDRASAAHWLAIRDSPAYSSLRRMVERNDGALLAMLRAQGARDDMYASGVDNWCMELQMDAPTQQFCGNPECGQEAVIRGAFKACAKCRSVSYCCKSCQVAHWQAGHTKECKPREGGQ